MDIYYNFTKGCLVDSDNCRINEKPIIYRGEKPLWSIWLFTGDVGTTPSHLNVSDAVAWRAAIDADWNTATVPMCRTISGIQTVPAQGVIRIPLDANTQNFASALGTEKSKVCYFELQGLDSSGNSIYVLNFSVVCHNVIDPTGGTTPAEVPSGVAMQTWVKALVSSGFELGFSVDGSTNWHSAQVTADHYFRFRSASDSAAQWSGAICIGESYTLPVAAADTLGGIKVGSNLTIAADGTLSAVDTTYTVATTSANGLMSSTDKTKLDGLSQITCDSSAVTSIAAGSNVTLSVSGGVLTIAASGGGASTADAVSITDSGSYFSSSNVEGALQEIGASLAGLLTSLEEI